MVHCKRAEVSRKMPITKKNYKYIARQKRFLDEGVSVVVALRDMLGLVSTSKEAKHLVNDGVIEINGRIVKDINESIIIFNRFNANKKYVLKVLETGRFTFEESKDDNRLCKVSGKSVLKNNKIQLNLHDGTNVLIDKDKVNVGDSVFLNDKNKIIDTKAIEKGNKIIVISGRSIGRAGKIISVEDKKAIVDIDKKETQLETSHFIVI